MEIVQDQRLGRVLNALAARRFICGSAPQYKAADFHPPTPTSVKMLATAADETRYYHVPCERPHSNRCSTGDEIHERWHLGNFFPSTYAFPSSKTSLY